MIYEKTAMPLIFLLGSASYLFFSILYFFSLYLNKFIKYMGKATHNIRIEFTAMLIFNNITSPINTAHTFKYSHVESSPHPQIHASFGSTNL